ncbi:MAG TPA: FAD-dependent monooxygenase [Candidatus Acidoferrales bacterium]|jgi:flavin-dependent dehydrogenase|nr:FAD-dependent monooxygenase [Candidatus Acidoferrales bacterium]
MREIGIIGGGPAGAVCGEILARAGFRVTIFDEHLAWEKPCGGGLTQRALAAFPYLLTSSEPKKSIHEIELIAPDGNRARISLDLPIVIYSRKVLNGLLLDRAAEAGCKIVRARVTRLSANGHGPSLEAAGTSYNFDFVAIAAGARNAIFPAAASPAAPLKPIAREDLEHTLGYYIPTESFVMKIKFVKGLQGYVWSFPRPGHLSVGVCASMARHTTREIRELLAGFIAEEKLDTANATIFSHVLPSPRAETLRGRPVAGERWALIGDAAAWVDPITGEGIYYAMSSGEVLASAISAGNAAAYPALIGAAFRDELEHAARISHKFYHGKFLGGAVTTRMIGFARHSETFRRTLADIFAGTQSYRTLKGRLWRQLGVTLAESAGSFLRGGKATGEVQSTQN